MADTHKKHDLNPTTLEEAPAMPVLAEGSPVTTKSGDSAGGASIEAPLTRPFEGFTYIKKEWVDQEDEIEKVTFNMTLGALNLPADWTRTQSSTMMPEWGTVPLRRTWIVRLPTHFEGKDQYLFHYFFQASHLSGGERVSRTFTHYIAPHQFEFIDHSGAVIHARLHWSLGGWQYPQDTEMEVDGIDWGSEFSVIHSLYRANDPLYEKGRSLVMKTIPVPRRFHCLIWAPKGAEVKYCFHIQRGTGEKAEMLWDNNFGKDYSLIL
ncbi:hypothetical protein AUK22_06750 [bacterium CG2_30_54_10]|nr:MAG: hypothetical protein AUK22_06750 [bacterium CG2_30_54_10]